MPKSHAGSATDRLERIDVVTDSALAHLEIERLLEELLDRIRELLAADTATVLLLDSSGQHLVTRASSGMKEAVRQGARVRISGSRFAGRIATTREPLILDRVDETTVANPLLWHRGIRSLLGVPLIANDEFLGVLHVGTVGDRRFTDTDVDFLRVAADRVAMATRNRITDSGRAAALSLQRTLIPGLLPEVAGLDMAARYAPGEAGGVSGDWYDVFKLPSGWLCVTVGDVVGRGLDAATVMTRLRTAVRSYALDSADPAEVLTKLDRHVRHFEPQMMATVSYAMWEPSLCRMHLSLAGHLTPVMAPDNAPAELPEIPIDPPVGAGLVPRPRRTTAVDVEPGTAVLFYTDGLVERRNRPLDDGLALLRDVVRSGPTEALCSDVMLRMVGTDPTDDDIALLAIRREPDAAAPELTLTLEAVPESLADMRAALRRWLPTVGATDDDIDDLLVIIGEAGANVIEHAYGPGGGRFELRLTATEAQVEGTVRDQGNWRSARGTNRGRGTQLMQQLSDELRIEHDNGGTTVYLRRSLGNR
ncbi:anti-sigma regulatory factor (Ser/Thr protein kinase) [Prauserella isguenensis]|uniref:Anti-sigma regulatory factor (Ser/Thr protein kinase) n=1 Tax=Prauserella isguenensis TaxID=1470180 RepID=A0A839RYK6_9PSEU|nr:SpoIIE family protein phosphatase [Prauserella isguenensis]MBB3050242.1 anti-sigma regulatory factor (Ser/Thr protein kinase) [Prauserella isguenensis]